MNLPLILALIGICAFPAVITLLPPIRRLMRGNASLRRGMILILGLLSFGLCFWQLASLTAGIASFEYYVPPDYFHHVGETDPEVVARDMQRIQDFERSMQVTVDDLTLRLLLSPQPAYPDSLCYTEEALCDTLKAMQDTTVRESSYLLRLLVSGVSGFLSAGFAWLVTRIGIVK
jgi:hypothetical protein